MKLFMFSMIEGTLISQVINYTFVNIILNAYMKLYFISSGIQCKYNIKIYIYTFNLM